MFFFPAVLADCIPGTTSSFTLSPSTPVSHPGSTLLAVITHTDCYGCWLSFFLCPVKMGPICCPETLVSNYHTTSCNIKEERKSQAQNDLLVGSGWQTFSKLFSNISRGFKQALPPHVLVHSLQFMYCKLTNLT
jgi:hypothetical protein